MEVLLFVLVVLGLPLLMLAALTLLGHGAGRLYTAVIGRRQRRRGGRGVRSGADIWTDVIDARRDVKALRDRPDVDHSWTAWQRRDRRPSTWASCLAAAGQRLAASMRARCGLTTYLGSRADWKPAL